MGKTILTLNNKTKFTTRSIRHLLTWARSYVKRDLTKDQLAKAELRRAIRVTAGSRGAIGPTELRLSTGGSSPALEACALWLYLAGVKNWWYAAVHNGYPLGSAPPLVLATKREKPPENKAVAAVSGVERELTRCWRAYTKATKELERTKARGRRLQRRIDDLSVRELRLREKLRKAQVAAVEQAAETLSTQDFATRMRAKREGSAPASG